MANNSLWEGLKQLAALIFVNLVAFFLDPAFLQVAISIDALILGISVQSISNRKTEERLDTALQEMINIAKLAASLMQTQSQQTSKQQGRVVV